MGIRKEEIKLTEAEQAILDNMLFHFGQHFRTWRVANNYTQDDVAKKLGFQGKYGKGFVSSLENGKREGIKMKYILRAAMLTGHSVQIKWVPLSKDQKERKTSSGNQEGDSQGNGPGGVEVHGGGS